jgi:nicotinic acid mononucleotide adenylyltransferase
MSADLVLIMPGNNWTKKQPTFSLEERVNSLKAVCDQWPNVQVLDWAQGNRFDTSSTYQVVKEIEKEFEIRPEIVIGSDNVQNIEKWKKWEDLKDYRFYIINRGGNLSKEDLAKFKNPIYHSSFRPHVISSSEIRSKIDLIEQIPLEARSHLDLKKLSQNES